MWIYGTLRNSNCKYRPNGRCSKSCKCCSDKIRHKECFSFLSEKGKWLSSESFLLEKCLDFVFTDGKEWEFCSCKEWEKCEEEAERQEQGKCFQGCELKSIQEILFNHGFRRILGNGILVSIAGIFYYVEYSIQTCVLWWCPRQESNLCLSLRSALFFH